MQRRTTICWRLAPGRQARGGSVLHARMGRMLLAVEQSLEAATSYFMIWQVRSPGVMMPVTSGHRASVRAAMSASEEIASGLAERDAQPDSRPPHQHGRVDTVAHGLF